jgi:hypothetical protein
MLMRSALFWGVTQPRTVIVYRRFGAVYEMGLICCPETSGKGYHPALRNTPEERRYVIMGPDVFTRLNTLRHRFRYVTWCSLVDRDCRFGGTHPASVFSVGRSRFCRNVGTVPIYRTIQRHVVEDRNLRSPASLRVNRGNWTGRLIRGFLINEFYDGVAARPCDGLKCEGRRAERRGCCCALSALLLWVCAGVGRRLEQGGSRREEQWLARPPDCCTVRLPAAPTRCRVRISWDPRNLASQLIHV